MIIFPFGKAPAVILVAALLAGGWLLLHPRGKEDANLVLWSFAKTHITAYNQALPALNHAYPDVKLSVKQIHFEALNRRLLSSFWSNLPSQPDLVEIEISCVGTYFKGPKEQIGFEDLKPRLVESGMYNRIVRNRLATWSNRGGIYGIPNDVHPVMLAYRRDIADSLGICVDSLYTWDRFIEAGRRFTVEGERYMIELNEQNVGSLECFLFQRGGGYFDSLGNVIFDNPVAVATMEWFVPLVTGKGRIGADLGSGQNAAVLFYKALEEGYYLFFICPDWRSSFIQEYSPRLAGKMALMPIPAFYPGGRRTSTQGGTMMAITKACKDKDKAWKTALFLYTNPEGRSRSFKKTNIIPPFRDAWTEPVFHEPNAFWSGQKLGEMYIGLADSIPPQYSNPFVVLAKGKLSQALVSCTQYYSVNGSSGFRDPIRTALTASADEVRKYQKRGLIE